MNKRYKSIVGVLGIIALSNSHLQANTSEAEGPESFVKQYVEASNSNDIGKYMTLIHPASRACMSQENKFFFDALFEKYCKNVISSDYQFSVSDIKSDDILHAFHNDMLDYPVKPTHQVQISYLNTETYVKTTTIKLVLYDGKQWLEVLPCPKPNALEKMKAKESRKNQPLPPLNLSPEEQTQILNFAQKTVALALNFQQGDIKSFDKAQDAFLPEGWVAFKKKMQEGYLDSKNEITYSLSFTPSRDPKIVKRMDKSVFVRLPGTYVQKRGSSQSKLSVVVEVRVVLGLLKIESLKVTM